LVGSEMCILDRDGLLSYAFELLLAQCAKGENYINAAQTLSAAAGIGGMVAGQSADLSYSGNAAGKFGKEELLRLQQDKTAKMIAAPLVMAANLAGKYEAEFEEFGLLLGSLFQITDDILDVIGESQAMGKTLGKDVKSGKLTVVSVLGVEGAQTHADERYHACLSVLDGIQAEVGFLRELVKSIRERKK
ncbi:MAG: polyprenyl synthetase family protein, partial [Clostridia bacterium]|nr:polyprenyl synthetase family protein [Clostridia bacterium]